MLDAALLDPCSRWHNVSALQLANLVVRQGRTDVRAQLGLLCALVRTHGSQADSNSTHPGFQK